MVTFGSTQRYYVWQGDVDMRKSFDGLQGLVVNHLGSQGTSGDVYVFFNRRRTQVKMLVWDRSGFVIYYKRLEQGSFEKFMPGQTSTGVSISWGDLQLIMEGVEMKSVRHRKRYKLGQSKKR